MKHIIPHIPGPAGEMLKSCAVCAKLKPLSEFHIDRKTWDRLHTTCKSCAIEADRKRREKKRA